MTPLALRRPEPGLLPLRIGDIRQWTYCARVVYWRHVVPLPVPETPKMKAGRTEEARLIALEERRGLRRYGIREGQRRFDVWVESTRLALSGVVDMVLDTDEGPIPVDYKMVRMFAAHQRLQLAGYALLLEEETGRSVERGFLYSIDREEVEVVEMFPSLRSLFLATVDEIREMILAERMPPPTRQWRKCDECEYRRFCNDVF